MDGQHERLRRRIQAVWMATTESDHPRGAYSWFARRARVRPRTVRLWMTGQHNPARSPEGRRALGMLKRLENKGAKATLKRAEKRLALYLEATNGKRTRYERGH